MRRSSEHGMRWYRVVGAPPDPPKLYSSRPLLALSLLEYSFGEI